MALSRARAQDQMLTELELRDLIYACQTQTAQVAQLASGIVNNVLQCELILFPPEGFVCREYGVAYGSIAVIAHGANPVTVATGSAVGDVAPASGVGMGICAAGRGATFALVGHALTLWGTAGTTATLQVFTGCVAPAFG